MEEPQKHYAKCKKTDTKDYVLQDSNYINLKKRQSYSDRKHISGSWGKEAGEGTDCKGALRKILG